MKKQLISRCLSLAIAICLMAACNGKKAPEGQMDTKTNKGMQIIGQAVSFDPNKIVNEGKPINIEYWTWNEGDPAIKIAVEYQKIYPNVKINIVNHPWSDYWTKLPLALKGNKGPAIFNIHNSQHDILLPYLAPYEIVVEDLKKDFISVDAHVIDGKVYYIDSLINTGNIYYNKGMWKEAGLTEKDIPQTWQQLREVAKKLTKFAGGKLVQAGFNWNGETYPSLYQGLNYQKGQLLFIKDNKANYDNAVTKENMQFFLDLYEKDKVGSKDFGTDSTQSFGNGQSAMVYKWGWFQSELNNKYPDIKFGVFKTPTFDEKTPFAYDRYNGESTPGINKQQSKEQQAVAQDFLRFLLANDEYEKIGAFQLSSFPTKKSLANDKEILENPVLKAIAPRVERLIWPGPFPATVEATPKKAMEEVLYNGKDLDAAIKEAQDTIDKDMKDASFKSLEASYKFISEAK